MSLSFELDGHGAMLLEDGPEVKGQESLQVALCPYEMLLPASNLCIQLASFLLETLDLVPSLVLDHAFESCLTHVQDSWVLRASAHVLRVLCSHFQVPQT